MEGEWRGGGVEERKREGEKEERGRRRGKERTRREEGDMKKTTEMFENARNVFFSRASSHMGLLTL